MKNLSKIFVIIIGLSVLAVMGTVLGVQLPYLSSTSFCLSCHEMKTPHGEYMKSVHFNSPSGVRAECAGCHIPASMGPKIVRKIAAVKEVYGHFTGVLDGEEKFEQQRPRMAKAVWASMKANDSRECRSCHHQEAFVFAEFKKPKEAERMQKGLKDGQTCIDCHKGLVHTMPDLSGGFKKLFEELQAASAAPKIKGKIVYPITTVLCYNAKEGEKEGRVLAATRLTVLDKSGGWLKVRAEGYQQDGVNPLIYELQGKRIFAVALDKSAREKPVVQNTTTDNDTELIWHQVAFDTWVETANMVEEIDQLWDYAGELHGATCGACHSVTPANHFLANQWIGGMKDMKKYISLGKEEYRFLQKYLQLNASDVSGAVH